MFERWARATGMAAMALIALTGTIGANEPVEILEDWQNPAMIAHNQAPSRATFQAFSSERRAQRLDPAESSWRQSLDGRWKFFLAPHPDARPGLFFLTSYDDSAWGDINVPSNWRHQGHDLPAGATPAPPGAGPAHLPPVPRRDNAVGTYRRWFETPRTWRDRQVFLHFDGVESAFYLWINGRYVGYNQNSRSPAVFNITPYLTQDRNLVALEVYRWSDGAYLDSQNFQGQGGVFRSVYLTSTGDLTIGDFSVNVDLDDQYQQAVLNVEVTARNFSARRETFSVDVELLDPRGRTLFSGDREVTAVAEPRQSATLSIQRLVAEPRLWSAESPTLYTLLLKLRDITGSVVEVVPWQVGFRKVEIRNDQLLVNGRPIRVRGVNRHEHHPDTGHAVSLESMLADIRLMKRNNINAVRMAQGPDRPEWYDLCDRYGLYVINTANVGLAGAAHLADHSTWNGPIQDRIESMVTRDRNHTSVIAWSLGHDSGQGASFESAYQWIKVNDPTRPVQYEPAGRELWTDIVCPAFPSPTDLLDFVASDDTRPLIMSRYGHAMGAGMGDLGGFWNVISRYPQLQGGFLWHWADRGVRQTLPDGRSFWVCGDGSEPDGASMAGLLFADRAPKPALHEVRKVYQPIAVEPVDLRTGSVRIQNEFDFTELRLGGGDGVDGLWELREDDRVVNQGRLTGLTIAPGHSALARIDWSALDPRPGAEYWLDFSFRLAANTSWADRGYKIAWEQFRLPIGAAGPVVDYQDMPPLFLEDKDLYIRVRGQNFEIIFSRALGFISSYKIDNVEMFRQGPQPYFWRAPTDHHRGERLARSQEPWRHAGRDRSITRVRAEQVHPQVARITVWSILPVGDSPYDTVFTIYGSGEVAVESRFRPGAEDISHMPRFGMVLSVAEAFENIAWYGRGPHDTYWDRKQARVGLYEGTVEDQRVPYARPQESGAKEDVRWVALTNRRGQGLMALGMPTLSVNAQRHTDDDLERAEHPHELPRRNFVTLNLDFKQMGLGGDHSATLGGAPRPEFRLAPRPYAYRFSIRPVEAGRRALPLIEEGRRRVRPVTPLDRF